MAKKYASLSTLQTFLDNLKNLFATKTEVNNKANATHSHAISEVTNLQSSLDAKVPTSRTINSKPLSANVTLSASDVGAASASHSHNDLYYTESEIDTKLSAVNTSIDNIKSGEVVVKEAEHADSADNATSANHATSADSATSATKATQDGNGKVISSTYETKADATSKLTEAKTYADNAANKVKNDLLNNAGGAYDTLKELGDLIDDNKDAIDALETVASGKANAVHTHAISDVTGLQSALDGKAASSHGTHVSYSTTAPVMDGTASVGTATTVARSDHKHPTDTSRASKTEFDSHNSNTTVHITATERTNWNAAKTHADSAHAPSDAQKNQNAFSNIKVGTTTIAADTTTDTLTLEGTNVTITPDATNDKVSFSIADATTSAKGVIQLTDSVTSTSTTTAATPKNVKAAYDLANTAKTTADGKANASHTHKVANITDLTATATELNYMDGVTSNVQVQIDANKEAISNIVEDEVTTEIVKMSDAAYWWATAYGNGRFVATVSYGYDDAGYSDDGINWVNTTMPSIGEWDCVTFGNDKFVSLNAETSNQGAYSTDGITWISMTMPVSAVWTDVVYGDGIFVAVASETNAFATSKDGIHWTSGTMPSNNNWKSIAYDNGTFVAVTSGTNSTVAAYGVVQNDTVVWNETTIPAANWHTVRSGNGKFVAISVTSGTSDSNSAIGAYSTDGINWIATEMPEAAKWRALAYGAGIFIAAPSNTVKTLAYTRDGINWNIVKFSSSGWWNSASYGDGKFFLTSGYGNSSQAGIAIFKNKAGFAYRDEVTLDSLNVYSKEDHEWTLIHDSGKITSKVNTISGIDISGYKHLMVAVSCVNDGSNISKSGSVIFTASSGKTYQFPCWTNLFSTSTDVSSAGMAWFDVINGYLVCPYASRNIRASKFLSSTEGGTADNLTSTGGGIMKCTKPLTTLAVSSLDQDASCYFGVGSRVMVWGCKA